MELDEQQALVQAPASLTEDDRIALAEALKTLAKTDSIVTRLAGLATGLPARIGARGLRMVPGLEPAMAQLAQATLARAFDIAVLGLPAVPLRLPDDQRGRGRLGTAFVGLSGALGGFAGLAGFVPDAFVTTLAIMRSVARIAQEAGEDLAEDSARLACLSVFATPSDQASQSHSPDMGYFLTRSAFQGAPIVSVLAEVARRYGMTLSQKLTLQAVPIVGAAGGAALNIAYMAHYRSRAHAVFVIRRLQRRYGMCLIRSLPQ